MKNKLFYAAAILLSLAFTSCSTSRGGYSSHKKGYGCPNSTGMIVESKAKTATA